MRCLALFVAGCGRIAFAPLEGDAAATDGDGNVIEMPMFGPPERVNELSTTAFDDDDPWLSSDMLEIYFDSTRAGFIMIMRATRTDTAAMWGAPVLVPELDNGGNHGTPVLAPGDLVITLDHRINGSQEILISQRASRTSPWSMPVHQVELGSTAPDFRAVLSADLLRVYFSSQRIDAGAPDLFFASRASTSASWSTPQPIVELNSPQGDADPWLSADELTILYATDRYNGERDIVMAVRSSLTSPFGPPVALPVINSPSRDTDPWLSPDGATMYFSSERDATDQTADIYVARR